MKRFRIEQIEEAVENVSKGLGQYLELQNALQDIEVVKTRSFQKKFNHFYRVRRNQKWQTAFYETFSEAKKTQADFREICATIYRKTGRWEASFASKLAASLDPRQPVIDSVVLSNLNLKLPSAKSHDRLSAICELHESLLAKLNALAVDPIGIQIIDRFKQRYPDANLEEIKILDLVLWQLREKRTPRATSF